MHHFFKNSLSPLNVIGEMKGGQLNVPEPYALMTNVDHSNVERNNDILVLVGRLMGDHYIGTTVYITVDGYEIVFNIH